MNRRGFLLGLGAVVGGVALERAIPLGRVWSFPSKIVVPTTAPVTLAQYCDYISVYETFTQQQDGSWLVTTTVGDKLIRAESIDHHPFLLPWGKFKLDVVHEPA